MSVVSKSILISLSGLGVVGTGFVGTKAYKEFTVTIGDRLTEEGYVLISSLSEDQDNQWTEEYKLNKADIDKRLSLENMHQDSSGGERLKKWCLEKEPLPIRNLSDEDLSSFFDWCVLKPIVSWIRKESVDNKELLTKSSSQEDWQKAYESNKSHGSEVSLTFSGDKDQDIPKLKEWCHSMSKKNFLFKNKETEYNKVVKFCTKDRTLDS